MVNQVVHRAVGTLPQPDWRHLWVLLTAQGYDVSPRRWQLVVATLSCCTVSEQTPEAWQRLLAPILCRSGAEQAQLPSILAQWLPTRQASAAPVELAPLRVEETITNTSSFVPSLLSALYTRLLWPFIAFFVLWAGLELVLNQPQTCHNWATSLQLPTTWCSNLTIDPEAKIQDVPEQGPTTKGLTSQDSYPLPTNPIPIRVLASDAAPPVFDFTLSSSTQINTTIRWLISALPFVVFLLLVVISWQRRKQLAQWQRQQNQQQHLSLSFSGGQWGVLDQPQVGRALIQLRKPIHLGHIQTINWPDSIRATLNQGPLNLVTHSRSVIPGLVLLVARRPHNDWNPKLANMLRQRLIKAGFAHVPCFQFQGIATHLRPLDSLYQSELGLKSITTEQFSRRYAEHRVVILADVDDLTNQLSLQPLKWLQQLFTLAPPVLITTSALAPSQSRRFMDAGFELAPFSSQGLRSSHPKELLNLPYWPWASSDLSWQTDTSLQPLKQYFGSAWLLLCGACIYPEFDLELVIALDQQLYPNQPKSRMERVMRLGVSPWARTGRVPDVIRQRVINQLTTSQRVALKHAYDAVFTRSTSATELPAGTFLQLHVSHPNYWRAWLRGRYQQNAGDAVFLAWAMGGWRSKLAFVFPRWVTTGAALKQSVLLSFTLISTLGIGLGYGLWQGLPTWLSAQQSLSYVQINHTPRQLPLAQALQAALQTQTSGNDSSVSVALTPLPRTNQQWQLSYPQGGGGLAQQITDYSSRLSWGASLTRQLDNKFAQQITINLGEPAIPAEQRGFRDTIQSLTEQQVAEFLPVTLHKADPSTNLPVEQATYQRQITQTNYIQPAMFYLKGGSFIMGGTKYLDEKPKHTVQLPAFWLMENEVTFAEYQAFVEHQDQAINTPKLDDEGWGTGSRPVINVSWQHATDYAQWLSQQTGEAYYLPTEAQWEYAARANTITAFSFGDCLDTSQANYDGAIDYNDCGANTGLYRGQTVPVEELEAANAWGLRHMHGNVWEWVQDCWHSSYLGAPMDDTAWLDNDEGDCSQRVLRGGSWFDVPSYLRSANRSRRSANDTFFSVGFRLARAP